MPLFEGMLSTNQLTSPSHPLTSAIAYNLLTSSRGIEADRQALCLRESAHEQP